MQDEQAFQNIINERERELSERTEELEAQREELTAAVEAVTQKNKHLEEALMQLDVVNKEVDQIVYRSAHDLKTPITAIEGLLQLTALDPENQSEYIERALASIRESKYLLNSMANYSKNLVKEVTNDNIIVAELWDSVLNSLKKIPEYPKVKINFSSDVESFQCDRFRVKQLIYNLVRNTIDFSKDNSRSDVSIRTSDDQIVIKIIDNGLGIEQDIQKDVFGMFYRGNQESKGAGLGLYLSKRIVDILKGSISLVSYPEVGTTVIVKLPQSG